MRRLRVDMPAIDRRDLERSITQLLEPRIHAAMTGDEPFYVQHDSFEHETMARSPAQPPAYDLAFVWRTEERLRDSHCHHLILEYPGFRRVSGAENNDEPQKLQRVVQRPIRKGRVSGAPSQCSAETRRWWHCMRLVGRQHGVNPQLKQILADRAVQPAGGTCFTYCSLPYQRVGGRRLLSRPLPAWKVTRKRLTIESRETRRRKALKTRRFPTVGA